MQTSPRARPLLPTLAGKTDSTEPGGQSGIPVCLCLSLFLSVSLSRTHAELRTTCGDSCSQEAHPRPKDHDTRITAPGPPGWHWHTRKTHYPRKRSPCCSVTQPALGDTTRGPQPGGAAAAPAGDTGKRPGRALPHLSSSPGEQPGSQEAVPINYSFLPGADAQDSSLIKHE